MHANIPQARHLEQLLSALLTKMIPLLITPTLANALICKFLEETRKPLSIFKLMYFRSFAPGTDIVSIYNDDDRATHTLTGTSMAAPHVTGAIALLLSSGDYTPVQMQEILKNTSSLLTEDFEIDSQNNANKMVLDNAINVGLPTNANATDDDDLLRANLLFADPIDNRTFEVFGELYSAAHALQPTITLTLMFVIASLMSQLPVNPMH